MSDARRSPALKRHPRSGGYARGEEQRLRIVKAALKVFGDEGYERASTRMIAKEAGIQPPALQYYFDSKEGLNRACAEFMVAAIQDTLSETLRFAEVVLEAQSTPSPSDAADALCTVLEALLDASLFKRDSPELARFSARSQSENCPAGPILREKISKPIQDVCSRLTACATGEPLNNKTQLRAKMLVGQIMAFHVQREFTLQSLGWPDFDGPRRQLVKTILRAHTRSALGFPLQPNALHLDVDGI